MVISKLLFLNQDDPPPYPDLEKVINVENIDLLCLDGGMGSGRPSIALKIDLPDGQVVIAQTSARLFCLHAKAIMAKYPDLFDDH